MNEECFTLRFEDGFIHGILHKPYHFFDSGEQKIIVFLHGWAGYRVGPHDMLVKLARKLALAGYHCLRFDFRGKGFSYSRNSSLSNITMLSDLEMVLEYVEKKILIKRITLLGICSGAKLALYYGKTGTKSIENIIEISSTLLKNQNSTKLKIENVKANWKEYYSKLFYKETWEKIFSGTISYSQILENVFGSLNKLNRSVQKRNKMPVEIINRKGINEPFANLKGNVLSIHGEKDPETKFVIPQIIELINKYGLNVETHIINGANHSFYSLTWEQELFNIITNWLNKKS